MWVLALLLSCGPGKPPEAPPPAPAPAEDVVAPAPSCMEQCLEHNGMRAVAWEVIEADCSRSCGEEEDPVDAVRDLEPPPSP